MEIKKVYIAELSMEAGTPYLFSSRQAAKAFMARYTPRKTVEWCGIYSRNINPKRIGKFDSMWFSNTLDGKALLEREKKEIAKWAARQALKTPLDEIIERLNANISVNSYNAKENIQVLRSLKNQIKELAGKTPENQKAKSNV